MQRWDRRCRLFRWAAAHPIVRASLSSLSERPQCLASSQRWMPFGPRTGRWLYHRRPRRVTTAPASYSHICADTECDERRRIRGFSQTQSFQNSRRRRVLAQGSNGRLGEVRQDLDQQVDRRSARCGGDPLLGGLPRWRHRGSMRRRAGRGGPIGLQSRHRGRDGARHGADSGASGGHPGRPRRHAPGSRRPQEREARLRTGVLLWLARPANGCTLDADQCRRHDQGVDRRGGRTRLFIEAETSAQADSELEDEVVKIVESIRFD